MKVKLPKECTGEEVINAFKKAALSLEISEKEKWGPKTYEGEIEFEPGSVAQITHEGAKALMSYWRKGGRFLIFKRKPKWILAECEASGPPEIRLLPLRHDKKYATVDILVGRELYGAVGHEDGFWSTLGDDKIYNLQLKRLIGELYKYLR